MPPFHEAMHRLLHEHHHDEPPVVEPPADDLTGDGATMLYIGCALALLSSLSQIGKGLQKQGVNDLPELTLTGPVVKQYFSNKVWVLGLTFDIVGALIGLASLGMLPVSIAQPIFANGLVLLSLYSYFYLKEPLSRFEWVAVGVCFVGTLLLAFTLEGTDWRHVELTGMLYRLIASILLMPALLPLLELISRKAKAAQSQALVELCTALQAGTCVGVGNAGIAGGLQVLSHGARGPQVVVSGCIVGAGIVLTAIHPVFANRGYKSGRVVVITAYITLVSLSTGILMGLLVLDEPWPSDLGASLLRVFALAATITGVSMLNWKDMKTDGGDGAKASLLEAGALRSDATASGGGPGFTLGFSLPFKREEVFQELVALQKPLGADGDNLKLSYPRGGVPEKLAVGCMRKAEFARPFKGHVLSELVELKAPELVRWAQRESDCAVNFVSGAKGAAPEFSVSLASTDAGTELQLSYSFEKLSLKGLLCVFAPVAPMVLRVMLGRSLPAQWAAEMERRGYKAITDEAATKLQAKARGQQARKSVAEKKAISGAKDVKLPRSEAQREADRAEEARLKGTAMDKAKGGTPVKK